MFPKKNRSFLSSEENGDRPSHSRNYDGRRYDRNGWNNQHDDRRDDRRSSYYDRRQPRRISPRPPSSGYAFERRGVNDLEQMREKKQNHDLVERNEKLQKQLNDLQRQKELEEEALNQRFCPFGDSDSSGDGGGAPIYVKKKKDKKDKKKKKRRGSSGSSSSSSHDRKRIKLSDDDDDKVVAYEFLQSLNILQPKIFIHTAPEKKKTRAPEYENRRKSRKVKEMLDPSKLKIEPVEYLFPPKEPTEKEPGVFHLEEVPYDIVNSASVGGKKEIDWERIPFEDFIAMEIMQQNIFAQSSASKKVMVYKSRLRNATTTKEKIDCYINLVNLEDARVEESRKSGSLTGKFDTNSVKLGMIVDAIRNCGEHVDLRLLEIDILTATKGVQSDEVKKAWNSCMNRFPNDLKMWRRRLTYYRNKRSVFDASSYINDSILPCLNKLGGIINQTFKSHPKQEGTEEFIIDVIASAAAFHIELGSTAAAIGILQALVEFYILVPKTVKDSFEFKRKLIAFECFWQAPIAKAGHSGALGWNKVTANPSYTQYEFKDNLLINAEDELLEFEELCKRVFMENSEYCQNDKIHSNCVRFSKVEKCRTEKLWAPIYNAATETNILTPYNRFSDIKPYLMQLPKNIVEKTIFKILTKLGAVFPDVKDYSQEAIFQRCHVRLVDEEFKMKYSGMQKFIDNTLNLMSGAEEELFLYGTVARIMTAKAFVLDNSPDEFQEANAQFIKEAKRINGSLIRGLNAQEEHIVDSYVTQLINEIKLYCSHDMQNPIAISGKQILSTVKNIFDSNIEVPQLLGCIRYYVMMCRNLPYYADNDAEMDLLTKLKFLMAVSFPNEEIDYEKKEMQQKAIKRWENIRLHENDFNLPSASYWIGDINIYALELFSTLCYEVEVEPELKLAAFKKFYPQNMLERNENLTEVFFNTWHRHVLYYYEEKTSFMDRLKYFIDVFPRNDILTLMYVGNLRQNEMETRNFFLLNQLEDDVVKVLRCVIQLATEFENIRYQKLISTRKTSHRYFLEILKESAELSLTNIIPDSYLWRSVLFFVKHTQKTAFENEFIMASDQCPWSKTLLTYAASLSTSNDFVRKVEEFARKAGIELLTSLVEIKDLNQ